MVSSVLGFLSFGSAIPHNFYFKVTLLSKMTARASAVTFKYFLLVDFLEILTTFCTLLMTPPQCKGDWEISW